jgi:hypothetical protein
VCSQPQTGLERAAKLIGVYVRDRWQGENCQTGHSRLSFLERFNFFLISFSKNLAVRRILWREYDYRWDYILKKIKVSIGFRI